MAIALGSTLVLKVETAVPGTYVTVNDLDKHTNQSQRPSTKRGVFARATAYTFQGANQDGYTWSGIYNPTDAGQLLLIAAKLANTPINVQVLWDGTNGFKQQVYVSQRQSDAAPEGGQDISFNLEGNADPVIVGTGPLMQ